MTLLCAFGTLLAPAAANAMPEPAPVTQGTNVRHNEAQAPAATISITEETSVVTAGSGYHLKAEVRNTSGKALAAGALDVATNSFYTFVSRTDIQQWADGDSRITVPNEIGRTNVPALAKGASTTVSIDVNADNPALAQMVSWGPKPVRVSYGPADAPQSGRGGDAMDENYATTHTFFTRSTDGLNTADTPAMNITIAMPLTSDAWHVDDSALKSLMRTGQISEKADGGTGSADVADNQATLNALLKAGDAKSDKSGKTDKSQAANDKTGKADKLGHSLSQLIAKHPQLQVVTDPTYAQTLAMPPKSSGIMQPGAFDINAYTAIGDAGAYEKAGLGAQSWSEATAVAQYRSALNDKNAKPTSYAWQADGNSTLESLANAKRQGYGTVIDATGSTGSGAGLDDTTHTGKFDVPTDAGDVTVLSAQSELSRLAQGKATDRAADGERSTAGRLARFMAQSAFYQMERPYASRDLLVCLSQDSTDSLGEIDDTDGLMRAVEQAPWLSLKDLGTLSGSEARLGGAGAARALAGSTGLHAQALAKTKATLASLAASRNDIARFGSSVLTTPATASTDDGAKASGDGNDGSGNGKASDTTGKTAKNNKTDNDTGNSKTETGKTETTDAGNKANSNSKAGGNATPGSDSGDAQSLARQDADATARHSKDGCTWFNAIMNLHDAIALHALSSDDATAQRMDASARSLASQLLDGVSLTPSESITVVSESAQMPVTVSNSHPYPVKVRISSITNSMEVATSRFATVEVPARSETQTTFHVRVSTSGSATAHLQLLDRNGDAFSAPQSTRITGTLRLSDMSGIVFVVIALLLGVFGLWRQFHRVKDPDE
ncbi:DUF6049 family protein [Bifidobacterium sp. ESL0763]|uniref:DUF6049 family protein n=1 Tax=Bifidobacterium sp. ESL0763 TaxID=2983227 RepID=UPI0023F8E2AA|nr:DUF6049 family protein [Bifidobacterium sp. ESL0763]MDF7663095.1 DUF6049 family protein [Bifidobacterium sp. ESL0763]